MALHDLDLPMREIKVPHGGSFSVGAIDFRTLASLARKYGAELEMLYRKYEDEGSPDLNADSIRTIGGSAIERAPQLVAELIASAAGEPDMWPKVERLSFAIQIEALEHVLALTFDAEGGPKKVVETVIRALRGTTNLLVDLKVSPSGSLASGGR